MSKPASRQELIDYCLRQLGEPVIEINVAEEQLDDLVDDALQYFQERHFDGIEKMYLKYKFTEQDLNKGKGTLSWWSWCYNYDRFFQHCWYWYNYI